MLVLDQNGGRHRSPWPREPPRSRRHSAGLWPRPCVLGVLCGMPSEARSQHCGGVPLDLETGQLAVVASTEQTKAGGCREKETKSGRARTHRPARPPDRGSYAVTASSRLERPCLNLGIRATPDHHVVAPSLTAHRCSQKSLTHAFATFSSRGAWIESVFASTICGTATPPICWRPVSTPRWPASAWATVRSASRSISIPMSCPECRRSGGQKGKCANQGGARKQRAERKR